MSRFIFFAVMLVIAVCPGIKASYGKRTPPPQPKETLPDSEPGGTEHPSTASEYNICYETKIMYFNASILTREPCEDQDENDPTIQWCYKQKTLNVTVEVKYRKCCAGWTLGETGFCDVPVEGECTVGCLNGGTCVPGNDSCACPETFTGDTCEIPVCKIPCRNAGRCTLNHTCECVPSFRGEQCQTPIIISIGTEAATISPPSTPASSSHVTSPALAGSHMTNPVKSFTEENRRTSVESYAFCAMPCQNGGTCMANGLRSQCICTREYYGRQCETAVQTTQPPTGGCHHADQNFVKGDVFTDGCTTCLCVDPNAPSPIEGTRCATAACMGCQGAPGKRSGFCSCPTAVAVKPTHHKDPTFNNCPAKGEIIVINLRGEATSVSLVDRITARDYMGRAVSVDHSADTFYYRKSTKPEGNIDMVVATTCDQWGGTAKCSFIVRVNDPIAPHFTYCPSDIFVSIHDTKPYDPRPTAVDNVGLREGMPRCEKIVGGTNQLVTCRAVDFEGNEAYCQFTVRRFSDEDLDDANKKVYPEAHGATQTRKLATLVGAPVAGVVLILIVAVVLVVLCRRHRRGVVERDIYEEPDNCHHHGHHGHGHHGHHHHPHDDQTQKPAESIYTLPRDQTLPTDQPPDYECVISQDAVAFQNRSPRPDDTGYQNWANYTKDEVAGYMEFDKEPEYTKIDLSKM